MPGYGHLPDQHPHQSWDVWFVPHAADPTMHEEWNRCAECGSISFVYLRAGPIPEGAPTEPPGGS